MMFGHNNHSNDMSGNKTKSVTDLAVNGISVYLSLCYSETPQKKSIYVILKRIFKKWNGLAKIIDNAMLKKENKGKRKQVKEFDRTISRHCSKDNWQCGKYPWKPLNKQWPLNFYSFFACITEVIWKWSM